jgi:DICT domain-containing protein
MTEHTLDTFTFTTNLSPRQMSLHSRSAMLALSYIIEDTAARIPGTTLIAAFQRWALLRPQMERYARLTPDLAHTYIAGIADTPAPEFPKTTMLALSEDAPLIHEWVVIASGPRIAAALVARDRETCQPASRARSFAGLWTTDPALVDRLAGEFFTALGEQYPAPQRENVASIAVARELQDDLRAAMRRINRRDSR